MVYKAQISHGRIAIRGHRREGQRKADLYVFDLVSNLIKHFLLWHQLRGQISEGKVFQVGPIFVGKARSLVELDLH